MPLSQDKHRQITHKIHASQFPAGKDVLKQFLNGDPKELWYIDTSEDRKSESGNESEVEKDNGFNKSHFKSSEDGHFVDEIRKEWQDDERYEWRQRGSEDYKESGYSDENRYWGDGKRVREEKWTGEYCCRACVCRQQCIKTKARTLHECELRGNTEKTWRRSPDEFERRTQPKCKTHGKGCGEYPPNRTRLDCDEKHHCSEWSGRYQSERTQKIPVHLLRYSKPFKNVHQAKKTNTMEEQIHRGNLKPECCHHTKKILDSYEELPAVDESLEHLSEGTYKTSSYTNFPNVADCQSLPKNGDKTKEVYERTPSWMLCDKAADSDLMPCDMYPERFRKARSRRTRMNRSRYIKWKKALIHPVVEGSRKEMVGVMVWGRGGPEYYSKLTNKKSCLPFRKSRSFPEDQTKSDDISFNFDLKDSFAASEPERKPRSKPITPEEDGKIEEKIATFDKNFEELVNMTNEKFFRSLSKEQRNGDISAKQNETAKKENESAVDKVEDTKKPQLMPCELLSSRAPKSAIKSGRDIFAFNVESKIMAETLNEKGKQFRLSQLARKEDKLCELEKKYPPKELDKETKDANLSLWGMKRNEAELKELTEAQDAGGEGDGKNLSLHLRIPPRLFVNECELHPKKKEIGAKPENEATESATEKLSDEMHREKRKKYYASMQKDDKQEKPKRGESSGRKEDAGESPRSEKLKATPEHEQILFDIFKNLVKEGCAISEKESEKLQKILQDMRYEADTNCDEATTSEIDSKTSEETIRKEEPSPRYSSNGRKSEKKKSKKNSDHVDDCQSDGISRKLLKLKQTRDDHSERKKLRRDLKGKRRHQNVEKIKLKMIREALPSMAAENEAAHLKQLKKYIHRFIDGVELKISSSPESRRRHKTKSTSSESSEVRVDAQKVIDLVSNPFKRITSDVTIDMAKKLTDALVQETSSKSPKNFPSSSKTRKNSDETEDASLPCPTTSGSDRDHEPDPPHLEGLKKMRNDHLNNIMMEVRRLKELIRFLDRCNRLRL